MEEKILIQSKSDHKRTIMLCISFLFFLSVAFLMSLIYSIADGGNVLDGFEGLWFVIVPWLVIGLIVSIILFGFRYSITVTDKRVYGNGFFGKRVDLPFDSISAVITNSIFSGVYISTSSGAIKFIWLENYQDIHKVISGLLIKRQRPTEKDNIKSDQNSNMSTADELKKFKELFDQGVITQEEFDAKKKQILGL